ncbi:AAEL010560-PA [Aedes aegypti]|uniref:AAEL010560-PA n=1 Tax=Aedes aegypti TaxID=7159 RepID=Q16SK3_AEDAE|nr:AAEL010560-PA [Aedes aegypti]
MLQRNKHSRLVSPSGGMSKMWGLMLLCWTR